MAQIINNYIITNNITDFNNPNPPKKTFEKWNGRTSQEKRRKICLGENLQRKTVDGNAIFQYKVNILVKQHNVFCSITTTKDNKTLHMCSSGKYKVKMSKKTLTYTYYWFLRRFFAKVKKLIRVPSVKKTLKQGKKVSRRSGVIVNLVSPRKLTMNIVRTTRYITKKRPFVFKVIDKKIYNGCRPPKKVRKKRRRMRNYK